MRLTTFTDYTLRVLMYLALDRSRLATIPEITGTYGISRSHVMKVVHRLARSEVIESVRGNVGGLRLARSPETIRIGEIVRATEGNAPIVECLSGDPEAHRISGACRLAGAFVEAFDELYASLDRYTLADLTGNRRALMSLRVPAIAQLPTARTTAGAIRSAAGTGRIAGRQ